MAIDRLSLRRWNAAQARIAVVLARKRKIPLIDAVALVAIVWGAGR